MKIHYRQSFSSLGCPELGWEEFCQLNRRFGIHELELRCLDGDLDLPGYLEKRFGRPAAWADAVKSGGMAICGLSTSLKLVGAKPGDREPFLKFLPWADAVGGAPLRVFDGGTVEQGLDDGGLDQALETIAWWRGERQRHGWLSDIIIETHDSMARSERLLQLQDALGEQPVDVLWDTHHTWKKGAEAVPQTWAAISRWVRHVHVKDSVSIPSQRHPYTYVLPGTGEFPLLETLRMLNDAGYPHIVSLEWEKLWHPYLVGMDAALEAMAACHARLQA